ncbi:MAG: hypothetical protein RL120_18425 [Gammaproteobacteria bacterium]
MKTISMPALAGILLALLSPSLSGQTSYQSPGGGENPFIGTWDLDAAGSQFGETPVPQNMSRTYADLGGGQYMYMVVQLNSDGSLGGNSATYRYDGAQYAIANLNTSAPQARISYRKLNERTVEYTVRVGDEVTQIGAKTMSPDGRYLTIAVQFPASGQSNQILRFNRR